ncbi:MAG: hypothetical protein ACKVU2_06800 [Saprospiraceae bacterium]
MRFFAPCCTLFAICLCCCWGERADSPEAVVRLWQSYIDRNQFDSARLYSTEQARSYIDFLDALLQGDSADISNTELYQLKCDIQGDSAVCHYLIEGELEEKIPDTLVLYRVSGRWLVHRVEGYMVIPSDTLRQGEERRLFPGDSLDVELE